VYGWMMEEYQPNDTDYQPTRDDDYIEDTMTQHYTGLMKIVEANQGFEITLFPEKSLHTISSSWFDRITSYAKGNRIYGEI